MILPKIYPKVNVLEYKSFLIMEWKFGRRSGFLFHLGPLESPASCYSSSGLDLLHVSHAPGINRCLGYALLLVMALVQKASSTTRSLWIPMLSSAPLPYSSIFRLSKFDLGVEWGKWGTHLGHKFEGLTKTQWARWKIF